MEEVLTPVAYLPMRLGDCLHGLFPSMTSALFSRQGRLQLLQLLLCLAVMTWIVEEFPIGECDKMGHAEIDSYILIGDFQGFGLLKLAREAGVPVLSLALDGECLDRARYLPVQMQFDRSDLRETQIDSDHAFLVCRTLVLLQFPACSIGVGK